MRASLNWQILDYPISMIKANKSSKQVAVPHATQLHKYLKVVPTVQLKLMCGLLGLCFML